MSDGSGERERIGFFQSLAGKIAGFGTFLGAIAAVIIAINNMKEPIKTLREWLVPDSGIEIIDPKLGGLPVDGCIASDNFPADKGIDCSDAVVALIGQHYCRQIGYETSKGATSAFAPPVVVGYKLREHEGQAQFVSYDRVGIRLARVLCSR